MPAVFKFFLGFQSYGRELFSLDGNARKPIPIFGSPTTSELLLKRSAKSMFFQ